MLFFQNRDDVKVLLLPISSGANGLNLIEASHVLLIEPILNPAQVQIPINVYFVFFWRKTYKWKRLLL